MVTDELVAVFDADGQVTGAAPRSRVYAEGLWHASAGVLVRSTDGSRIYVPSPDHDQGRLRGHARFVWPAASSTRGSHPRQTATRELAEELGITGGTADGADFGGVGRSMGRKAHALSPFSRIRSTTTARSVINPRRSPTVGGGPMPKLVAHPRGPGLAIRAGHPRARSRIDPRPTRVGALVPRLADPGGDAIQQLRNTGMEFGKRGHHRIRRRPRRSTADVKSRGKRGRVDQAAQQVGVAGVVERARLDRQCCRATDEVQYRHDRGELVPLGQRGAGSRRRVPLRARPPVRGSAGGPDEAVCRTHGCWWYTSHSPEAQVEKGIMPIRAVRRCVGGGAGASESMNTTNSSLLVTWR